MLASAARFRWILVLVAAWFCPHLADASITFRIGVSSNLLVIDRRVYFTQVDGSVTCPNLETGQVLGRSSARDYSGTLDSTPHGILLRDYDKVVLIDPITLSMRWEAREAFSAALDGEALITEDGNGAVERRSLASGQVLWTYHLPGALVTAVHGSHVLVHRQGRYQGSGQPTLSLLDPGIRSRALQDSSATWTAVRRSVPRQRSRVCRYGPNRRVRRRGHRPPACSRLVGPSTGDPRPAPGSAERRPGLAWSGHNQWRSIR